MCIRDSPYTGSIHSPRVMPNISTMKYWWHRKMLWTVHIIWWTVSPKDIWVSSRLLRASIKSCSLCGVLILPMIRKIYRNKRESRCYGKERTLLSVSLAMRAVADKAGCIITGQPVRCTKLLYGWNLTEMEVPSIRAISMLTVNGSWLRRSRARKRIQMCIRDSPDTDQAWSDW